MFNQRMETPCLELWHFASALRLHLGWHQGLVDRQRTIATDVVIHARLVVPHIRGALFRRL